MNEEEMNYDDDKIAEVYNEECTAQHIDFNIFICMF